MKLLNILLVASILIAISCNKKEEPTINPCANGVKDNGEEDIDCGGPCKACYHYPYLIFTYRNMSIQCDNKTLSYINNEWILEASFDTISFQINFGSNGNEGTYNITAQNSFAIGGQLPYQFVSGTIGIGDHDEINRYMKGNFEASFAHNFDTIKLEDGQFEYLQY